MRTFRNRWQRPFQLSEMTSRGQLFYKLFGVICISVCIPVLVAGFIYYHISMTRTQQQLKDNSQASLLLVRERMERELENLEKSSLQLSLHSSINEPFNVDDYQGDYLLQYQIFKDLVSQMHSADFIENIYFYRYGDSFLMTTDWGYASLDRFRSRSMVEEAIRAPERAAWLRHNGMIVFVRKLPVLTTAAEHQGVMLFVMKETVGQKYLSDYLTLANNQSVFLIDAHKRILFSQGPLSKRTDDQAQEAANFSKIIASSKESDAYYDRDSLGNEVLYTYAKTRNGRFYITSIPKNEVIQELLWIRWVVILSVALIIFTGVVINVFFLKRAYNPIEQLMKHSSQLNQGRIQYNHRDEIHFIRELLDHFKQETESVGNYLHRVKPTLREQFLKSLLEGNYIGTYALEDDCEKHGIPVKQNYLVLVAEVEHFYKRFDAKDKPVIAFAIANVMEEVMNNDKSIGGYTVKGTQGLGIAVLQFHFDTLQSEMTKSALNYAELILESVRQYLRLSVSIGIGHVYGHLADLPLSYQEALKALRCRIYNNHDHIFNIEELENQKKQAVSFYPKSLENQLLDYLGKGEPELAERALNEFSQSLRSSGLGSYHFIHQSYHLLLASIISSLESRGISALEILEHNLFEQLGGQQTSDEITDWFASTLFPLYLKHMHDHQSAKSKQAIAQICKYIEESAAADISLVQCAEMVNLSPSYVSRLFKKEVGLPFQEFVMKCKVEKIRRLLLETELSVSEIAAAIGYSERNLIRLFQRYMDISPGQFRMQHR